MTEAIMPIIGAEAAATAAAAVDDSTGVTSPACSPAALQQVRDSPSAGRVCLRRAQQMPDCLRSVEARAMQHQSVVHQPWRSCHRTKRTGASHPSHFV